MTHAIDRHCSVLMFHMPNPNDTIAFSKNLESKDDDVIIDTLKTIILHMLNGENLSNLIMQVIKFCLRNQHHTIKKLLLLFWEVVDKKDGQGKLLHEMILVCNALKQNLDHPNEFVRGSTLRFLCRMQEQEILEPLIPSITANLEHRHAYVRKNAVLTVWAVYSAFPDLMPDAPEQLYNFLQNEARPLAKRNAFMMLSLVDQTSATRYLCENMESLSTSSESFQLLALELIRKVCRSNPASKSRFIRCIFNMVNSEYDALQFEGAKTLLALSNAPTAVRAAITAFCQLLNRGSDNNVKLIILDRLSTLKNRHSKLLAGMLLDIMRTLNSPNIDIRRQTLLLALDLVTLNNAEDVVMMLKKEIVKTDAPDTDADGDAYKLLLVDALHKCAVKFPSVVASVLSALINYLGDTNANSALDVIYFVREIVEQYDDLRDNIVGQLLENFWEIRTAHVYRVALWILGEYATSATSVESALETIRTTVGALPLVQASVKTDDGNDDGAAATTPVIAGGAPVVLSDGTYAQQSSVDSAPAVSSSNSNVASISNLRSMILSGDFFLAACLANTMTKLTLRNVDHIASKSTPADQKKRDQNLETAKTLMLLSSIMRLGQHREQQAAKATSSSGNAITGAGGNHSETPTGMDKDSQDRILLCLHVLLNPTATRDVLLNESRSTFATMLSAQKALAGEGGDTKAEEKKKAAALLETHTQADDCITIRQLKGEQADLEFLDDDEDIDRALASSKQGNATEPVSKLNRIFQLTGFADPVYAEALLTVVDYDILLDILIVNQTDKVMQNLGVELGVSGDLKIVERPQPMTVKPRGVQRLSANIKVSSTESGVIFGNIVYDSASGTESNFIALNSIHMDILDYISPATCSDTKFRSMWAEFEWENKVAVATDIDDVSVYLVHICKITNMNCLTPDATLSGTCNFLAANLYARSMFGEDALLNLSVEKQADGKIGGYIRIRSKTQGVALSLGDKITSQQRVAK